MSSTAGFSDADESLYLRTDLKRSCRDKPKPQDEETKNFTDDSEQETSEELPDNSSDEDFSLNKPRKIKKKTKVKKDKSEREKSERRPRSKKPSIPSFNQVMLAQVRHQLKFIDYDNIENEESNDEDPEEEEEIEERPRTPTPVPEEPPKEKRRKIIIYPWNPIGITGGRPMPPINDVRKLQ
jgi:hypothetical protein